MLKACNAFKRRINTLASFGALGAEQDSCRPVPATTVLGLPPESSIWFVLRLSDTPPRSANQRANQISRTYSTARPELTAIHGKTQMHAWQINVQIKMVAVGQPPPMHPSTCNRFRGESTFRGTFSPRSGLDRSILGRLQRSRLQPLCNRIPLPQDGSMTSGLLKVFRTCGQPDGTLLDCLLDYGKNLARQQVRRTRRAMMADPAQGMGRECSAGTPKSFGAADE
jgi:hypothetical protein